MVAIFVDRALRLASTNAFDFDELLAVWTARLPTHVDVIGAIWKGAEYSPPTYDLLLHLLFRCLGSYDALVARLPSLLGMSVAIALVTCTVWRRVGPYPALVAAAVMLNSKLFDYAIQARPYGLIMAAAMSALFLWDSTPAPRWNVERLVLLALLLFACLSLHFYAFLIVGTLCLGETLRSLKTRRLRLGVWVAIAAALGAAAIAWSPLVLHLAAFNKADTQAAEFYGRPSFARLIEILLEVLLGSSSNILLILVAVAISALVAFLRPVGIDPTAADGPAYVDKDGHLPLTGIALSLLAILPAGFLIAVLFTGVFSARYALAAIPGLAILIGPWLARPPFAASASAAFMTVACLTLLSRGPSDLISQQAAEIIRSAGPSGPIVVGDSWLFLVLLGRSEPEIGSRLIYVTAPPETRAVELTGENQLRRLLSFLPNLRLEEPGSILSRQRSFRRSAVPAFRQTWSVPG